MFILMASTSILVGNRKPLQILGISLAIPLGFYIAVTHVMRTALPEIDLVQRALAPLLRLPAGLLAADPRRNHADRRAEIAE